MMKHLRVLHVEDSERDVLALKRHLSRAGYDVVAERVETLAAMSVALRTKEWDVILCDYTMPQFDAMSALKHLQATGLDIPFIIISGNIGEETAVEAMLAGAHDYLMKDNLARLAPAIEREMREAEIRQSCQQAEEAHRASEDRYRDLVEYSHDLICTHDLEGRILSVNQTAAKLLGYDQEYLLDKNIRDILFTKLHNEFDSFISELVNTGIAHGLMSVQTKTGEKRIWEYTNTLRTEGVAAPIVRGTAHDITEQKRAEAALMASTAKQGQLLERQSGILDALPAHICLLGAAGNILEVNATWRHFALLNSFGGNDFGIGSNYLEVCDSAKGDCSADAKQAAEGIRSVLAGKLKYFEVEYPCHSPDEMRWFRLSVTPIQEDASAGVVVMHVNTTERKQADNVLRRQLDFTSTLTNSLGEGVYALDKKGCVTFLNPAAEKLLGWTEADLLGKKMHERIHFQRADGTRVPGAECILLDVLRAGKTVRVEDDVFTRRDETMAQISYTSSPIISNGQVTGAVVAFHDITERKRAAETLQRSEEYFRSLIENATDIVSIVDADGVRRYISPSVERLLGYRPEELIGQNSFGLVHPEDVPELTALFAEGIKHPSRVITKEFRFRHKDGTWRTLEMMGRNLLSDPNVAGIIINSRDITKRKQAEHELAESERRYRPLGEGILHQVWTAQPTGQPDYFNRRALDYFGLTTEQMRSARWSRLVHPDDVKLCVERARRSLQTGDDYEVQFRLRR
ncbi:MAG: PAS domain S-box protein, partial [Acidobacteria bacterium]|nr:PAS domain S-box protein [Acidobacteriota bacterium]